MGNIKLIESLFCLRTNQVRNRRAIRTQIRTRVDGPLGATTLAFWMCRGNGNGNAQLIRDNKGALTRWNWSGGFYEAIFYF
jgi:hypothetical protein